MKGWKFWNPDSGAIGGLIMGVVIGLCALLAMPAFIIFFKWWFAVWGV